MVADDAVVQEGHSLGQRDTVKLTSLGHPLQPLVPLAWVP